MLFTGMSHLLRPKNYLGFQFAAAQKNASGKVILPNAFVTFWP
jgi:hypothetical protein